MRSLLLATLATLITFGVGCSGGASFAGSQAGGTSTGSTGGVEGLGGSTGSGGAGAEGGLAGSPGSDAGYTALSCDQLTAAYLSELAAAKLCNGNATSQVCTTRIEKANLPCGCPTFVNAGRVSAIANLQKIAEVYTAKQCEGCAVATNCPTSDGASCTSSGAGSSNRCVDNNAN